MLANYLKLKFGIRSKHLSVDAVSSWLFVLQCLLHLWRPVILGLTQVLCAASGPAPALAPAPAFGI